MPDYAHRYSLWRSLIVEAGGLILKWSDRFDLSSLTKVSDGYTGLVSTIKYRSESLTKVVYAQDNYIYSSVSAGHIKYAVEQTLTDRRVIQVSMLKKAYLI